MPFQLKIKSFRIYYGDDTTFDGFHINQWLGAPIDNVQAVLLEYEDGKPEIIAYKDYYSMLVNQHGLRFEGTETGDVEFVDRCLPKAVKVGKYLRKDKYFAIIKKAQVDRDAL